VKERLKRLWRRVAGCRACHGSGVVMDKKCTCGRPAWSLEMHEAYCGVDPCPNHCAMAGSHEEAVRVWVRYRWPSLHRTEPSFWSLLSSFLSAVALILSAIILGWGTHFPHRWLAGLALLGGGSLLWVASLCEPQ
jgi:hypothetical protein